VKGVDLRRAAREIFDAALKSVNAHDAVRRAVRLDGSHLSICETTFELEKRSGGIYALAIGKAALPMAVALDEILGEKIRAGLIVAPDNPNKKSLTRWRHHKGAHPLPDESSLRAARDSFELLERANEERAFVIFLISGGGSAMIEWPRDESVTLANLRMANRALVSCGASIAEINAVRRAFSAVKGGKLAARAPEADQVSLIISDTGVGQESIVASGLTYPPPPDAPDAASVIERYKLADVLPAPIMNTINQPQESDAEISRDRLREHYVLLDNGSALEAAAAEARRRGFAVEVARDISEQPIEEGCALMLARLSELRGRAAESNKIACLISGGEFSCPVRGDGRGGRNAETVLRCAIEIDEQLKRAETQLNFNQLAMLSAGTDGIDGNSRAAGAVGDATTLARAREMHLDARDFLARSDAYNFFDSLGDAIMTGATGTNVRDLRVMLAV
jgi:hydroxypyruvate reductase